MAKNKKRKLSTAPKASTGDDHEEPSNDAATDADDPADPNDDPQPTDPSDTPSLADDDHDTDPAAIQSLLDPFSKDQLIDLLRNAALKHADVLKEIHKIADVDTAHRKIFVHGLGWDTTTDTLRSVFAEFGEIEDCKAVIDKATGKSKGYGFILFKNRAGAQRALKQPQKKIGNRTTSCQLASAGPVPPAAAPPPQLLQQQQVPAASEYTQRKIFVSNVGAEVDSQKLLQFFAQFGEIEEGPLGLDKATGKPKGFALFVYKSVESARKALKEPHKNFEGNILHCQKAIDGPKPNKAGFQFHGVGGGHQAVGAAGSIGSQYPRSEGGARNPLSSTGHLMAPSATGLGFNQSAQLPASAAAGLNPALGHALTAFLATQGAGLGLNVAGNLGSSAAGGSISNLGVGGQLLSSGVGSYGNQVSGLTANMNNGMIGGYGAAQSGYASAPVGRGAGRNQHGHGHMGGIRPYRG